MRDDAENAALKGCGEIIVGFAVAILFCLLITLCSCRPTKEVQVERVEVPVVVTQEHTIESVKIDHIRDTLIQRDSIYHYVQGDTTIIERWHYLQGTTNVARIDTLHIYDSVPYPVETVKTKEVTKVEKVNVLKWWQKILIGIGGFSLIGLALIITWTIGKSRAK